jgi:hypothetical protein
MSSVSLSKDEENHAYAGVARVSRLDRARARH